MDGGECSDADCALNVQLLQQDFNFDRVGNPEQDLLRQTDMLQREMLNAQVPHGVGQGHSRSLMQAVGRAHSSHTMCQDPCTPGTVAGTCNCPSSASTIYGTYGSADLASSSPSASGNCVPQCTWECDNPKCDEVCTPKCQAAKCETRCPTQPDLSKCCFECDEPACSVECPKTACPNMGCASCQTTCSEPQCKLSCEDNQKCWTECEQPQCEWECKAPEDCPKPECHMVCQKPPTCMTSTTYQKLPALKPGETSVSSFSASVSFLQTLQEKGNATLQAPAITIPHVHQAHPHQQLHAKISPKPHTRIIELPVKVPTYISGS